MSTMTVAQGRVIDPILSTVAQGYKHAERVGKVLFPAVDVTARGGTILEFGRESFRLYSARRAPSAPTLKIPFGYVGKPYALVQDALEVQVPRELLDDAKTVLNLNYGVRSTNTMMFSLTLTLEDEQAKLATNAANYGEDRKKQIAAGSHWNDPASDPLKDIDDAKEAVRSGAGLDPNRMVISKPIFTALRNHPKINERFKYTSSDSITAEMLAAYFELDILAVGKSKFLSGPEDTATFEDVWGNNAILAYVPQNPQGFEEPSYGYTYTLKGHPFVEQPYWEDGHKSWAYGVTYERLPVLTGIASGFLFSDVVGAVG